MKTQEEIKQLANEFSKDYIKTTNNSILQSSFKLEVGYIKGYTQCQEDMAKILFNISKLVNESHYTDYSRLTDIKDYIKSLNKQD